MDFTMDRRNFVKAASLAGAASLAAGATAAFADEAATATPKYIFLFIGDGMGNEQVQITSFFKGTTENDGAVVQSPLTFMGFPHVGSVTTYDSTSFCPDSASTATSIATGNKTKSGITHGTYAHTGAPVNIYAMGCGSELFDGAFDNTEIFNKLAQLTQVD